MGEGGGRSANRFLAASRRERFCSKFQSPIARLDHQSRRVQLRSKRRLVGNPRTELGFRSSEHRNPDQHPALNQLADQRLRRGLTELLRDGANHLRGRHRDLGRRKNDGFGPCAMVADPIFRGRPFMNAPCLRLGSQHRDESVLELRRNLEWTHQLRPQFRYIHRHWRTVQHLMDGARKVGMQLRRRLLHPRHLLRGSSISGGVA